MDKRSVLVAENVSVTIGKRKILHELNLKVEKGEFIGIIGPNGAGKSTLLKALRGLTKNTIGSVKIFDRKIAQFSDKEIARHIAYMQQEVNLGFGFSALDVVLAGRYPYLSWWQNERKADYEIARKYMSFTGVADLEEKKVNQLSGGERQRVLLAKVLAQETPLLYLDEPTASLDLAYQEEIFRYCQSLCNEGKTVLIIVHDIRLAVKFCSRLVLIANGTIVDDGKPEKVITAENLKNVFGLNAAVYTNQVSGKLDIYTFSKPECLLQNKKIHMIGGNGTSGSVIRKLYEQECQLSIGVLEQGDIDTAIAKAFQIESITTQNFNQMSEMIKLENKKKIETADLVVLTNCHYTEQNYFNLEMASLAKRLIVIEETPIEERDFTKGKATVLYKNLLHKKSVTVHKSDTVIEEIRLEFAMK
ncbi:MAG: hmuV 3 [Massilibacillus sp.]|jgi:iron complex transport system ATP-binding protein|nr:hmuV 3 [Massilibacillus sp.]